MTDVDLLLSQVCDAMNMLKLPVKLVTGQKCEFRAKCLHGQINFRINTAQALIKTKFDIVSANLINLCAQDAFCQVEMSLSVLTDIMSIMSKDLVLTKQLSSKHLMDEEVYALIKKVGEMIAVTSSKVKMLPADLYTN